MRELFFKQLEELMQKDERVYFITADLGYFLADRIRDNFPDRFFNVGAAEQVMVGMAIGLALEGKIPFCYSITPFLLFRPFEAIRTYIAHERIPVILVGSGRDDDYIHDGFSHDASDDLDYLPTSICPYYRYEKLEHIIESAPSYINLSR